MNTLYYIAHTASYLALHYFWIIYMSKLASQAKSTCYPSLNVVQYKIAVSIVEFISKSIFLSDY